MPFHEAGSVGKVGTSHHILHGADFTPATEVLRPAVEAAFVTGKSRWVFDDHERCQMLDKEEMRRILRLSEDWKAV